MKTCHRFFHECFENVKKLAFKGSIAQKRWVILIYHENGTLQKLNETRSKFNTVVFIYSFDKNAALSPYFCLQKKRKRTEKQCGARGMSKSREC